MTAYRAWMDAALQAEGLATASGLSNTEFDDADRALAGRLLDSGASALAAEDASLRAAFSDPRWTLPGVPQERRAARGLGGWVFEQVLVYVLFKEWARLCPVVWDETEPGGRRRPDLLVFDAHWRARFALEAKWWSSSGGLLLDAPGLRARAATHGARPLLLTFLSTTRRELLPTLRAAALDDGVTPVHLGVFPAEHFDPARASWRTPGVFAIVTFAFDG
ncbi:MAG: hypothetical protein AB8I08_18595 [Sandaracinaceae bacterium]